MKKINKSILSQIIAPRNPNSYKGNYGKILIIAGSLPFGGAAIMSSSAAVHAGAGLVTVATVQEKFTAINTKIPEAMTVDYHNIIETSDAINKANVIVIGPGLGTDEYAKSLVHLVLDNAKAEQTLVLDASALTIIAQQKLSLSQTSANLILTPHQGEWRRLSGLDIDQQTEQNNQTAINKIAPNALLIVKKHHSEIYYQDQVSQITAGNAGMATGGMGDTLTGIIAALVGQFDFSLKTVEAALFLHSFVADKIFKKNYVVLPEMLIKNLPKVMKKIANNTAKG